MAYEQAKEFDTICKALGHIRTRLDFSHLMKMHRGAAAGSCTAHVAIKGAEHGSGLGHNSRQVAIGMLEDCAEGKLPQTNSCYSSCTNPRGQNLL